MRPLFTRESRLESDWYQARLDAKQTVDARLWIEEFLARPNYQTELARLRVTDRLAHTKARHAHVTTAAYRASLVGTIGLDPALL